MKLLDDLKSQKGEQGIGTHKKKDLYTRQIVSR